MIRVWIIGIRSLLLHPLRSLLTVLGIFIGVASVIWLLAIGEGISRKAQQQIEDLGANNIIVRTVQPVTDMQTDTSIVPAYGILRSDYEALVETIPTIERALRIRELRRDVHYQTRSKDVRLVGCTPDYAEAMRMEVARGRFLTPYDLEERKTVCVLAAELAEHLFPLRDPLGETIRIFEDASYMVVGVMKPRNATAAIGGSLDAQSFNSDVYIPIETLWQRIGDRVTVSRSGSFTGETVELSQITIQVRQGKVLATAEAIRTMFSRRHTKPDFAIVVPLELLEQSRTMRLMFIAFMGLMAAISLVVGGIGIMNIMLATVTERTREIGIRRALGARRVDITRQFLIETIVLSVAGGLVGILGGLTCPLVFEWIRQGLEWLAPTAMAALPDVVRDIKPLIVPWSIPLAFGISVAVGVVFGLYPAMRAASMDPIEALRHE
jgi:putative ABC transport system permease protein